MDATLRARDGGLAVDGNAEGVEARVASRALGVRRPGVVAAGARFRATAVDPRGRRSAARPVRRSRARTSHRTLIPADGTFANGKSAILHSCVDRSGDDEVLEPLPV